MSSTTAFAEMPLDTTPPPPRLESSPLLVTGYYMLQNVPKYVEIYNNSTAPQNTKDWTLQLSWTPASDGQVQVPNPLTLGLSGRDQYLAAKSYVVVSFDGSVTGASIQITTGIVNDPALYVNQLAVTNASYKPYLKTFTSPQSSRMYLNETSTGYTTTGAYSVDTRPQLYDSGLYEIGVSAPASFPLAPIEILANPRSCSPTEVDTACHEYVKFFNPTDQDISFANTRLRIGSQAQAATTLPLGGVIHPGEYAVFDHATDGSALAITNGGGYVWLEDALGIKTYENTVTEYADASATIHKGQSWALLNDSWQWALPSPAGMNTSLPPATIDSPGAVSTLTPCKDGQYRSPETNRCRNIEATTASLTPCAGDEYRSPDTNRCRKTVSTAASLQPCDAGQYRNTETNRCKSIAAASAALQPCAANQERNPDTNRCRLIASSIIPSVGDALTENPSASQPTIGWLGFGFVAALAGGYGLWEWRRELKSLSLRIVHQFTKK